MTAEAFYLSTLATKYAQVFESLTSEENTISNEELESQLAEVKSISEKKKKAKKTSKNTRQSNQLKELEKRINQKVFSLT